MIASHRQAFVIRSTIADIDRFYLNLLVFSAAFTLGYLPKTKRYVMIYDTINDGNRAADIARRISAERGRSRNGKPSRLATDSHEKRRSRRPRRETGFVTSTMLGSASSRDRGGL